MLRKAKKSETSSLAKIHYFELYSDFLSSLGEKFLRLLYEDLLGEDTHIYVVSYGDGIQGFVAGSKDFNSVFKKIIIKNFIKYSFMLLPRVLYSPFILKKIFETLFYIKKEGKSVPQAELIAIAVSKKYHRKGFGKRLVRILEKSFLQHNVREYKVSVNADNYIANSFYSSLGFKKNHDFYLYGKKINLYTKRI
ncbi:MAG: GNAT family N-acetyltransferase [Candidatus Levybacteria bacterium]|nr:GNAT family N-acetyltransferase [Candidatus Levybacteria bacterium]